MLLSFSQKPFSNLRAKPQQVGGADLQGQAGASAGRDMSADDESLMGSHQETASFSDFSDTDTYTVFYDTTPRPGEYQLFTPPAAVPSREAKRLIVKSAAATNPVSTADGEERCLAGIRQVTNSRLGKENKWTVSNSGEKGLLVKPPALYPPGKRASDVTRDNYPIKRATDTKPASSATTDTPVFDKVNYSAREQEWQPRPSLIYLEPARTTVMYPGWNQTWNVARYGEYEMEMKYGPLRHTRRPWLDEYDHQARCFPWIAPEHNGRVLGDLLYDTSHIYHLFDEEREGEMFYVDLFFQNRFYNLRAHLLEVTSPTILAQSWASFVREFVDLPSERPRDLYIAKVKKERKKFMRNTANGAAMKVHRISMRTLSICTVPKTYRCPNWYSDSTRLKLQEVSPQSRISTKLELAHSRLSDRLNLSINA